MRYFKCWLGLLHRIVFIHFNEDVIHFAEASFSQHIIQKTKMIGILVNLNLSSIVDSFGIYQRMKILCSLLMIV